MSVIGKYWFVLLWKPEVINHAPRTKTTFGKHFITFTYCAVNFHRRMKFAILNGFFSIRPIWVVILDLWGGKVSDNVCGKLMFYLSRRHWINVGWKNFIYKTSSPPKYSKILETKMCSLDVINCTVLITDIVFNV